VRIGVFTAVLGDRPFEAVLDRVAELGATSVEVAAGGYAGSDHCDPAALLADPAAARRWREATSTRGLAVCALSAHANPLHPDPAERAEGRAVLERALAAAELLEVPVVNAFSGCPGDGAGGREPNWVTTAWPPEFARVLDWQWEACALPYWIETAELAHRRGVTIAIEAHPGFLVYNVRTLLRLREAAGPAIAANFDPSHLWWQGADPLTVIAALGDAGALAHVHAKDTELIADRIARDGVLETTPSGRPQERAWRFRAVGLGHSEAEWAAMLAALRDAGYDGTVSVEHEDRLLDRDEGLAGAVGLLLRVRPRAGERGSEARSSLPG
jgi:sugar phosphate isomerase/epimerase